MVNIKNDTYTIVSTHSRPKAAGSALLRSNDKFAVSTHSRPKAAGSRRHLKIQLGAVSTHSRPKAAGWPRRERRISRFRFNTQPPEGGWPIGWLIALLANWFQHTAARRRLVSIFGGFDGFF